MHQGLPVPVHGGNERRHVLKIGLRRDGGFEIRGTGSAHAVLVGGVVKDLALLRRGHLAGVDGERNAAFGSQVLEERQFFGAGGIPPQGEGRAVGIAQDVMVGIEFHRSGSDDIQKVLGQGFRFFLPRGDDRQPDRGFGLTFRGLFRCGLHRAFLFLLLFFNRLLQT